MRSYIPILLLAVALALSGLGHANAQVNYSLGHIQIQRTLDVRQIGRIDPGTGAAIPVDESTVSLKITNTGPLDLQSVVIEENLDYLPPHARLSFSQQPVSDGRVARWTMATLPAGGTFSVWFTAPVSVPDDALTQAQAPSVSFTRAAARLSLPPSVDAGQDVALRLRTPDGQPLSGALIEVSAPDGTVRQLETDSEGRASFTASRAGFYTYGVPDYDVGFISSTEAEAPAAAVPPTVATLTPVAPKPAEADYGQTLWGLAPLAVGLALVAAIAFALYTYFNTMPGDEGEPMPPAPATRPSSGEREPTGAKPAAVSAEAGAKTAAAGQAGSAAAGTGGPSAAAEGLSAAQVEEELRMRTRELIAKRRAAAGDGGKGEAQSADEEAGKEGLAGEETPGEPAPKTDEPEAGEPGASGQGEAEEPGAGKPEAPQSWGFTEGTYLPPSLDEGEAEAEEDGAPSERAPAWMTQAQAPEGEMAEIDDEAIAKTIEELEQLRAELQERAAKKRGAGPLTNAAAAGGKKEYAQRPGPDEDEQAFGQGEPLDTTAPQSEEIVPAYEEPESAPEEPAARRVYPRPASAPHKPAQKPAQKKTPVRGPARKSAGKSAGAKKGRR
ncbi:MAG: hypothetical protein KGH63_01755 [Candidatus Micrarchaeota archaeon]|nr:hypothetical protein [Candidatus Micrarchaeota archaeon]